MPSWFLRTFITGSLVDLLVIMALFAPFAQAGNIETARCEALFSENAGVRSSNSFNRKGNLNAVEKPFNIQRADRNNIQELMDLKNLTPPTAPQKAIGLTDHATNTLFKRVANSAVTGQDHRKYYDADFETDLCYAVADAYAREAFHLGLSRLSVRKLFVIGHFVDQKNAWSYHVVTAVRTQSGEWLVLDPAKANQPIKVADWYVLMKLMSPQESFNLFITDPSRVYPTTDQRLFPTQFISSSLKRFFEDFNYEFPEPPELQSGGATKVP